MQICFTRVHRSASRVIAVALASRDRATAAAYAYQYTLAHHNFFRLLIVITAAAACLKELALRSVGIPDTSITENVIRLIDNNIVVYLDVTQALADMLLA